MVGGVYLPIYASFPPVCRCTVSPPATVGGAVHTAGLDVYTSWLSECALLAEGPQVKASPLRKVRKRSKTRETREKEEV